MHGLSDRVLASARGAFPAQPVRTLDALHLATALPFLEVPGSVVVPSFDERIRRTATSMGLRVSAVG